MSPPKRARSYYCGKCGKPGHNSRSCGKKKTEKRTRKPRKTYTCSICGGSGHNKKTCSNPPNPEAVARAKTGSIEEGYPGLINLLGTMSDSDLAKKYKISRELIRQFRGYFGVKRYTQDSVPYLDLLGTEFDTVIAKRFGVSSATVGQHRRSLGIPSKMETDQIETTRRIEQHLDLLGTVSDTKIAKMCDVTPQAVYTYRKRHNIETEVPGGWYWKCPDPEVTAAQIASLYREGLLDEEIAEEVGRTLPTVRGYLHKMGLPTQSERRRVTERDKKRILKSYRRTRSFVRTSIDTGWSTNTVRKVVLKERGE